MHLDRVIAVRNNKSVYRNGDECIKVFNAGYSKADVLGEAYTQAIVKELGIMAPSILEVGVVDGKWAIVSEFIKGKTLLRLISEDPKKKRELTELFVDIQLSLHEKSCERLHKQKDRMLQAISAANVSDAVVSDLVAKIFKMNQCSHSYPSLNLILLQGS